MDAFYVSCELLRRPELTGQPVVVGGEGGRGVVAAASYEARRYGVYSAMSSVQARRRCPQAVFIHPDHGYYATVSRSVHEILDAFTPIIEPIALDEAFLDVTSSIRALGPALEMAGSIRRRVADELSLSASVGVAPSKLIAKLASEAAKPVASAAGIRPGRGVVVVAPDEVLRFLHPHPVRALWGVGPKTLERLQRLGVSTVGDLAAIPADALVAALGSAHGTHLHELAHGRDDRPVVADRELKSVGHEETFDRDRHGADELQRDLVRLAESVGARLRANRVSARTVNLKIRYSDFSTITRSVTLPHAVDGGPELLRAARQLLDALDLARPVRLLGVSGSNLIAEARQLSLDEVETGWDGAIGAVDDIRRRFGTDAIGPARLVTERGVRVAHDEQWGPRNP
jgi:DNA polymerase-4